MNLTSKRGAFLGLILFSVVLIPFMDFGTIYMTGKFTSDSQRLNQFAPPSPLRIFDDSQFMQGRRLDGQKPSREKSTKPSEKGLHRGQTEHKPLILPERRYFSNESADNVNASAPHLLCGCGYCFQLILQLRETGHILVNIKALHNSNSTKGYTHNEVGSYSDMFYFNMNVEGDDQIWSTLVSDQDVGLKKLDPIRVSLPGNYNVSLTLIYTNKSSAYGIEKIQRKEMHCPLCKENGTCHLMLRVNLADKSVSNAGFGRVPIRLDDMSKSKITVSHQGSKAYFRPRKRDELFFKCPTCEYSQLLEKCLVKKRFILLGDSHVQKIWNVLQNHVRRVQLNDSVQWMFRADGLGVYHNISPDKDFDGYIKGIVLPAFVPGGMIKGLRSGLYVKLQQQNNFDAWIFSSGHWDLRDVSIEDYITHLEELFQMWSEFQRITGVWLVWNGTPAYSFNRPAWGGQERRTNVKIALADHQTKDLCRRYNITYVPFFDISFPFYSKSCDTHHYLCEDHVSPIGSAQLNLLLQTICG